jgi:hypothetical protein
MSYPLTIACPACESHTTIQSLRTGFDKQNCLHCLQGTSICLQDHPSSRLLARERTENFPILVRVRFSVLTVASNGDFDRQVGGSDGLEPAASG